MNIFQKKKAAEVFLQGIGSTIRSNVSQGQKDFSAGKIGYGAINPFKGIFKKK